MNYTLEEILEAWDSSYGENMKVEYPGFFEKLSKKEENKQDGTIAPDLLDEVKVGQLDINNNPVETGQHILRAIYEYDEGLYEMLIKHANCIDNDEEKYHDGTADYDNDVDFAELWSIQAAIDVMTEKYYNVKLSGSCVIAEGKQK